MMAWFALSTRGSMEDLVVEGCIALELRAHCPHKVIWKNTRPSQRKKGQAVREKILLPLFPGYVFVEIDLEVLGASRVKGIKGVIDFVRMDGSPVLLPGEIIDQMMKSETAGLWNETLMEASRLSGLIGRNFSILSGPFKGFVAAIEKTRGSVLTLALNSPSSSAGRGTMKVNKLKIDVSKLDEIGQLE